MYFILLKLNILINYWQSMKLYAIKRKKRVQTILGGYILFMINWIAIWVCWGCHNNEPATGGLNNRNLFFHSLCLEIWDEDVSRSGFFWGLSPWHAHGLHMVTLLFVDKILFYGNTSHARLGAILTSFQLSYLLETIFKYTHILRLRELGFQHINFGKTHNSCP